MFVAQYVQNQITEELRCLHLEVKHILANFIHSLFNLLAICWFLSVFENEFSEFGYLFIFDISSQRWLIVIVILEIFLLQIFSCQWASVSTFIDKFEFFFKILIIVLISVTVRKSFSLKNFRQMNNGIQLRFVQLTILLENCILYFVSNFIKRFI